MSQDYIKSLNDYIKQYRRQRTYQFWTWYLGYLLDKFGLQKEAFLTRNERMQQVRVSRYVGCL
jgi:hypothetical protein